MKTKLAKAIGVKREARKMYAAGIACKGHQSGKDRIREALKLEGKVLWILGRLTGEEYREWIRTA